ncbi:MAG: GNAT family N-acetyltransferase [Rhodobacter sp.]|jgi:putative hemolysin|nr:GNAT family N-acetyltransferase [Rhodobacter sp.]
MIALRKGRYTARIAGSDADLLRAQRLRHLSFVQNRGLAADRDPAAPPGVDADAFDAACRHMLVEDTASGTLVCCFRLLPLVNGTEIGRSYSAQHYNLAALSRFDGPMVELGRFCIHPDWRDPDILRVAWGAMTRFVDATGAEMLFGCSSFQGTEAAAYHDAFAMLKDAHLAPKRWLPRVKAPDVFRFARALRLLRPDVQRAMRAMPPLLKTYLLMGGWVSDHAVVDRNLNTLHVFTGLEIRAIPPARARLLRLAAG